MKTLGCINITLVHLLVPPVCFQWHHPPYMLQFITAISYMLSPELRGVPLFHSLWLCNWKFIYVISIIIYISWHHWSVLLYVILWHDLDMYFWGCDQMIHYVFLSFLCTCIGIGYSLHLICGHTLLSLSMGMPASDMSFLSNLFHWFGRLEYGDPLPSPHIILLIQLIHFSHHVPLLTSYNRVHLL